MIRHGYDYRTGSSYVPLPPPTLVRRRSDHVFGDILARPVYRTPCDRCGLVLAATSSDLLVILVDAHWKRGHGVKA